MLAENEHACMHACMSCVYRSEPFLDRSHFMMSAACAEAVGQELSLSKDTALLLLYFGVPRVVPESQTACI